MPMRQKPGTRTFSAHEKLFHKAKTALQREFKRIKLFHIRKIVQQLKKLQTESSQCASTESTQTQLSKLKHKYDTLKGIDQDDLVGLALQKTRFLHVFDDLQELRTHYEREKPESSEEKQLKNKLISHKRLQPIYDSMDQIVRNEIRKQDKSEARAMKSKQKKEVLVGGRSNRAPESLFLSTLSGSNHAQNNYDEEGIDSNDDVAEFLGESKKKKNRPGQMARRQKAIRREQEMLTDQRRRQKTTKYGPSRCTSAPISSKLSRSKPTGRAVSNTTRYIAASVPSERTGAKLKPGSCITTPVNNDHPSWQAKRMLKEKERLLIAAPVGKKIRFGDDE
ncbi:unnamed protein product [Albugo candida]|uniref:Bud22 domain-containing protein n=2 Tax=Albugo candida TaxID=65357 RepID=A0A024GLE2_9STRA|nr:unnamed protein product [Albugo candida]|eukprot:CCI47162.1 unnamed protein product [Albugo candida]